MSFILLFAVRNHTIRTRHPSLRGPFLSLDEAPFPIEEISIWPIFYKQEADKARLLVNLSSHDDGPSLNDHMSAEEKYVSYISILTIIDLIVTCGLVYIWKVDALEVESSFSLPILCTTSVTWHL